MRSLIKDNSVTTLHEKGFKGSFPTFKRVVDNSHQMLNFQFNKYGGSFAVNLYLSEPNEDFFNIPYSKQKNISHRRLGTLIKHLENKTSNDHWFKFIRGIFFRRDRFEKTANELEICIHKELERTFEYMLENET